MRQSLKGILYLVCLLLPLVMQAQQKTFAGRVTDVNGNPLPGASVSIQKTKQGTITNMEGKFEINAPEGAILVVNFTGFRSRNIKLTGDASLAIVLEEDIAKLDEIVVTGLATTVKRRNAANSVASVSAKELTGVAPAQTFDAALSGKITGANIVANSGAPGGGLSVKLRGVSSVFGTTQPLYVIDGVIISNRTISTGTNVITNAQGSGSATSTQDNATSRIADINPQDIENVEILKGASASAIYGSQASAGVVIITTKKGKAGTTKVNVSQDMGFITARHLMGMKSLTDAQITARRWNVGLYRTAEAAGKLYDYEKEIYGNTGFLRNTSFTASGGTEKTTFLFSAGMRKEEGIIKNTGYANNSLRLNVNHRVSDRIKVGITSSYTNSSSDRGITNNDNTGVSIGVQLASMRPYRELHPNEKGQYPNPLNGNNILQTIALMKNNEKINRVISGINIDATLQQSDVSITKLVARGGVDFYNQKSQLLFPAILHLETAAGTGGRNVQGNANDLNTSWAAFLVNTLSAKQLSFVTTAGLTHEYGSYDQLLNIASQLVGEETSGGQASSVSAQQTRYLFRNDGIFFQEEIALKEFLNFTAGVRFDRSTNNGDYKKFNVYPKANMSWNIAKMGNWDNSTVNDLKFRIAYGESSGFPTFNSRFTILPGMSIGGRPGSLIGITLGDADIESERQTELEGGMDISFLNGKISFEATLYNKVIKDLLVAANFPASSGFTNRWVNAGSLRNRGLELGLRTIPVDNKFLRWNSTLNFWLNRSKVTKLNVPRFDQGSAFGANYGTFFIEEGKSATQILALNDDGELQKFGDLEPDYQLSFYNELTFLKNISLRFLLHARKGSSNINLSQLLQDYGGTSPDWDVPDAGGNPTGRVRSGQPYRYVQDASYLRFREIALYYRLPLVCRHIQNIRLGVSANNFITWTPYKGYDPEVSNFGAGFGAGVDVAPYPASKRLQFHLSLDF